MESIISTFHIDWKIIIAQAINFAIVFVVLYLFALKPLTKLMAERAEKINKGMSDAKSNAVMREKIEKEYQDMMAKAKKEANAYFQNGKKETEAKQASMIEEAKKEVKITIENGKKSLEMEKLKMVESAKNELASLTILAVEKIMQDKNK